MTINCWLIPVFQVVAATTQGVPESVLPPRVRAPSAEALHLSWSIPEKPNGIIKEYQLRQTGRGLIYSGTNDRRQHTVTGEKNRGKPTGRVCLCGWGGKASQGCAFDI